MQAERGHSSFAAPQCRHMQGFQTLLCRPVLPYTRVGSFRTLQRCVHDARYDSSILQGLLQTKRSAMVGTP